MKPSDLIRILPQLSLIAVLHTKTWANTNLLFKITTERSHSIQTQLLRILTVASFIASYDTTTRRFWLMIKPSDLIQGMLSPLTIDATFSQCRARSTMLFGTAIKPLDSIRDT